MKREVGPRSPEEQAAGKGKQVQLACQVGLLHCRRQFAEGTEGKEVFQRTGKLPLAPQIRLCPLWQRVFAPELHKRLVLLRQNTKAGFVQIGQFVHWLGIHLVQQTANESQGLLRWCLPPGRPVKALPESSCRSLLAAAEQGP